MCTVSFLPTTSGFFVAMNRDEKRSRVAALPPEVMQFDRARAVLPREPGGGTWIAVNDCGICLALINWHRIAREPAGTVVSRGDVILRLLNASSCSDIAEAIARLPLQKLRPFRLIAIAPHQRGLIEWQWDLIQLQPHSHSWTPEYWFSSGFDELKVEVERQSVCQNFQAGATGSISGLRQLHRSHLPERGPFSVCMHRPDAKTVSYTEVVLEKDVVSMRYQGGSPCGPAPVHEAVLPILRPVAAL
jgi:hypothetical protein